MRVRSMRAERSGRRNGSIATSLAVRPMPRTLRRTDLPITRNWKSFLRARLRAGNVGRGEGSFRARGQDVSYVLPVGFLDVANGSTRTITLPEGKTLQVTVPEGAEDRQMLRLRGQGTPGFGGGAAGDAYVELHVEPHAFFRRKDDNIHVQVPVTLKEAALGGGGSKYRP